MLKRYPFALYVTWLTALIIFPTPLVFVLNHDMGYAMGNELIFIDVGVIAYAWWLFEVYLATRPLWLDRLIGLPALYLVHSLLGVGALLLAYIHRHYLFSMANWIKLTGNTAWYLVIFGVVYASLFLSGWFVDRLPIVNRIKQKLMFILKHQTSMWIHRLNLIAIVLIWLHVHLIGRITSHLSFMLLFDLYSIAVFSCYAWKKIVSPTTELTGFVKENKLLNDRTHQLVIDFGTKRKFFEAGDFFFFTFKGISNEKHPFSVSNLKATPKGLIVLTIREVGDYTKRISQAQIGTTVKAEGPFGRFASILTENKNQALVLIGMGAGIAPLLNIASEMEDKVPIKIIWTVAQEADKYYDSQLKNLEGKKLNYHVQVGRLQPMQLKNLVTNQEATEAKFFIVGSAAAVLNVRKMLHRFGVKEENLIDERLTM
ncbi:iron reductase [Pediococcus siamensis]|uniref:iron reductase n=1 Tax=Pediococcus siamensis TaxID=381829 RepID=UPI0039A2946D